MCDIIKPRLWPGIEYELRTAFTWKQETPGSLDIINRSHIKEHVNGFKFNTSWTDFCLQILEIGRDHTTVKATLSDKANTIRATISNAAVEKFEARELKRITEGTSGGVLQILGHEVLVSYRGPEQLQIALHILDFSSIWSAGSGKFGQPIPIVDQNGARVFLQELHELRKRKREGLWPRAAQSVMEEPYSGNQSAGAVDDDLDEETNTESQIGFATQLTRSKRKEGCEFIIGPKSDSINEHKEERLIEVESDVCSQAGSNNDSPQKRNSTNSGSVALGRNTASEGITRPDVSAHISKNKSVNDRTDLLSLLQSLTRVKPPAIPTLKNLTAPQPISPSKHVHQAVLGPANEALAKRTTLLDGSEDPDIAAFSVNPKTEQTAQICHPEEQTYSDGIINKGKLSEREARTVQKDIPSLQIPAKTTSSQREVVPSEGEVVWTPATWTPANQIEIVQAVNENEIAAQQRLDRTNPHDLTTSIPAEQGWSEDWPDPILGRLDPPPNWYDAKTPRPVTTSDGLSKIGRDGKPVLDFDFLPPRLPSKLEPFRMETYFRMHPLITYTALWHRQPSWVPAPTTKIKNALNQQRLRRGREPYFARDWSKRYIGRPTKVLVELIGSLSYQQINYNTTWTVTSDGNIVNPRNASQILPWNYYLKNDQPHEASQIVDDASKENARLMDIARQHNLEHWRDLPNNLLPESWFKRTKDGRANAVEEEEEEEEEGDDEFDQEELEDYSGPNQATRLMGVNDGFYQSGTPNTVNRQSRSSTKSRRGISRISRRLVAIPKNQRELLDKEECWLPANPGHRDPRANMPSSVLHEFTTRIDRLAAKSLYMKPHSSTAKDLPPCTATTALSRTDSDDSDESEQIANPEEWPSSPNFVAAPNRLPSDTPSSTADHFRHPQGIRVRESGMESPHSSGSPRKRQKMFVGKESDNIHAVSPVNSHYISTDCADADHVGGILCQEKSHQSASAISCPPSELINTSRKLQKGLPQLKSPTIDEQTSTPADNPNAINLDDSAAESDSDLETSLPQPLGNRSVTPHSHDSLSRILVNGKMNQESVLQVTRTPYSMIPRNQDNDTSPGELPALRGRLRTDLETNIETFNSSSVSQHHTAIEKNASNNIQRSLAQDLRKLHKGDLAFQTRSKSEPVKELSISNQQPRTLQLSDSMPLQSKSPLNTNPRPTSKRKADESGAALLNVTNRKKNFRVTKKFGFSQLPPVTEDPKVVLQRQRRDFIASLRSEYKDTESGDSTEADGQSSEISIAEGDGATSYSGIVSPSTQQVAMRTDASYNQAGRYGDSTEGQETDEEETRDKACHHGQTQKQDLDVATQSIIAIWGIQNWERVFEGGQYARNLLDHAQAFATQCDDWAIAAQYILYIFYERVTSRTREAAPKLIASDVYQARVRYLRRAVDPITFITAEQLAQNTSVYNMAVHLLPIQQESIQTGMSPQEVLTPDTLDHKRARQPQLKTLPSEETLSESRSQSQSTATTHESDRESKGKSESAKQPSLDLEIHNDLPNRSDEEHIETPVEVSQVLAVDGPSDAAYNQLVSPTLKRQPTPLSKLTQRSLFDRFKQAYSDYTGNENLFLGMCRNIDNLVKQDRMEHRSLWDDFIVRRSTEYPQYLLRCSEQADNPMPYEKFYREEVEEPIHTKKVVTPASLQEIIQRKEQPEEGNIHSTPQPLSRSRLQINSLSPTRNPSKSTSLVDPLVINLVSEADTVSSDSEPVNPTPYRRIARSHLLSTRAQDSEHPSSTTNSFKESLRSESANYVSPYKAITAPKGPSAHFPTEASSVQAPSRPSPFVAHAMPMMDVSPTMLSDLSPRMDHPPEIYPQNSRNHYISQALQKTPGVRLQNTYRSPHPLNPPSQNLVLNRRIQNQGVPPQEWFRESNAPFNEFVRVYRATKAGNGNSFRRLENPTVGATVGIGRAEADEKRDPQWGTGVSGWTL